MQLPPQKVFAPTASVHKKKLQFDLRYSVENSYGQHHSKTYKCVDNHFNIHIEISDHYPSYYVAN